MRRALVGLSAVILAGSYAACVASSPNPYFQDAKYIRFGLDPRDEANELIRLYGEKSEPLALKVVGRDFTALGFMDRAGRSTRIRIITARGIVVALDPDPTLLGNADTRYALLQGPIPDTQDADGDGFEEVFVEARTQLSTCVHVYRVRDVGYVDTVEASAALFGSERCPNTVADLDHDGQAELLIDLPLVDFELDVPPTVRVALWPDAHRFVLRDSAGRSAAYLLREQAARQRALEEARAAVDHGKTLRLAVELAALAHVQQQPAAAQTAAFDQALSKLELNEGEFTWAAAARDQIADDWRPNPNLVAPAKPTQTTQLAERDASWYTTPPHEQEGQKRAKRRTAHLSKSKGRAKLRRGGKVRSGHRAHGLRSKKPAREAR